MSRSQSSPTLLTLAILARLSLPAILLLPPIRLLLLSDPESHLASPRFFPQKLRKCALISVTHLCSFPYKTRPTIRRLPTRCPRNLQAIPDSIRPRCFPAQPTDTKKPSGRGRSSLPVCNGASAPTCLSTPPTFPPSLDWD